MPRVDFSSNAGTPPRQGPVAFPVQQNPVAFGLGPGPYPIPGAGLRPLNLIVPG